MSRNGMRAVVSGVSSMLANGKSLNPVTRDVLPDLDAPPLQRPHRHHRERVVVRDEEIRRVGAVESALHVSRHSVQLAERLHRMRRGELLQETVLPLMHPRQMAVGRKVRRAHPPGRGRVPGDRRHRHLVVDVHPALPLRRPGPPERDEREPALAEELDPRIARHRLQHDDRVDLPGRDQLLVERDLGRALGRRGHMHAVPRNGRRLHQSAEQTVQEATQPRVLIGERFVLEVERQSDDLAATGRQCPGRMVRGVAEFVDRGLHGPHGRLADPVRRVQYVRHGHRRDPRQPGHVGHGRPAYRSLLLDCHSAPHDPRDPAHRYVDRPEAGGRRGRRPRQLGA